MEVDAVRGWDNADGDVHTDTVQGEVLGYHSNKIQIHGQQTRPDEDG